VIIGRDFRFGKAREGDLAMMQALGEELGFVVAPVADVEEQGARVSSTALRRALAEGDFAGAGRMLGRPYTVRGRVVRGQQLGRKLGYPTANIRPWKGSTPLHGVYAVQCRIVKTRAHGLSGDRADAWHDGVASVGVRPAVGGGETLLEVHLFDFNGDLYGDVLETRFVSRLRGEEDFPDMSALVAQMNIDSEGARAALAALNPE
jgi:riboflavin kinase/FMN adenylyltransferase